jgi:4-amino-4-deoxy-L-arabinose transferase-like glycosyltransferase
VVTCESAIKGFIRMKSIRDNIPSIIFWFAAAFLLFWYIGARGLWGPEDRWAEIVREMRLTGDYFHPCINGEPYFDKPLLSYWFIALVAAITGRLDEWTVRLPSAIAGLLGLWATMNLGRRLWSVERARTAGWILLSTYGFLFWSRTGEADMENMTAIILAVAWYWARREKPVFFSYFIFYVICFIGAQTKGLAAIVVPILVVLPDLMREKRWKSYLSISHFLAIAAGFLLYLAPLVYAEMTRSGYQSSGLWLAFRENIVRYFRPFDHKEPFYVYFHYLPQLFFPWIPLLVAGIWAAYAHFKKLDWPSKWLTISTTLIFLFFTLSGSRRSYYILPILPFCALMASLYFDWEKEEKCHRLVLKIQTVLLVVISVSEILSPAIWPVVKTRMGFEAPKELIFATAFLGLMSLVPLVLQRIQPGLLTRVTGSEKKLAHLIAMSLILTGGFLVWQSKIVDKFRTIKPFSMELKAKIGDIKPDNIAFYRKISGEVLFYMDLPGPMLIIRNAEELNDFLDSEAKTKVLVSHIEFQKELLDILPDWVPADSTLKEKVNPWEKKKKYEAWIIKSEEK